MYCTVYCYNNQSHILYDLQEYLGQNSSGPKLLFSDQFYFEYLSRLQIYLYVFRHHNPVTNQKSICCFRNIL